MLEQWDASQYVLGRPFIEYFDSWDTPRRKIFNRRRSLRSYLQGTARIPINVAPELLHKKPAERFTRLSRKIGKRIGFVVASFPYEDPDTLAKNYTPVHLCTNFEHNGYSVLGPWFPSLGHPVMTSSFPDEIKKAFVQESVYGMQEHFDAVIIGVPTRKDGSGTDTIFTDDFLRGTAFSTLACKNITYYLFSGHSEPDLDVLLDKTFFETIDSIELTRRINFEEYKKKAAKKAAEGKTDTSGYTLDVSRYLTHVFRRVLSA